jgi:ribosomal-protein-alanine N-acetyltransferase
VIELDHICIGYGIMSTGAGEAHVLNLCVDAKYRCRGIGSQLLAHLLEFAKGLSVMDVFLEVRPSNPSAIRLYQSHGFSQIGVRRGYYQATGGREDAVVLRKVLGKGRR